MDVLLTLLLRSVGRNGHIEESTILCAVPEAGLSDADIEKFKTARILTTGQLAFACSYVPGASDDKSFQEMVATIFGPDSPVGLVASIRRLFFEAYTS
eukprot:5785627-Amphidinium_carterae.1